MDQLIYVGVGASVADVERALAELAEPDDVIVDVRPPSRNRDLLPVLVYIENRGADAYAPIVLAHLRKELDAPVYDEDQAVAYVERQRRVLAG